QTDAVAIKLAAARRDGIEPLIFSSNPTSFGDL
ncbi:MAG: hypothetical protein ACI9FZ_000157, partial [Bacteroidia bacterium]